MILVEYFNVYKHYEITIFRLKLTCVSAVDPFHFVPLHNFLNLSRYNLLARNPGRTNRSTSAAVTIEISHLCYRAFSDIFCKTNGKFVDFYTPISGSILQTQILLCFTSFIFVLESMIVVSA